MIHQSRVVRTAAIAALATLFASAAPTAEEVETCDGMTRVQSSRVDEVFLLRGAIISNYHAIVIETGEVALKEDWQKYYNRDQRERSRTVKDEDVPRARAEVAEALPEIFA